MVASQVGRGTSALDPEFLRELDALVAARTRGARQILPRYR